MSKSKLHEMYAVGTYVCSVAAEPEEQAKAYLMEYAKKWDLTPENSKMIKSGASMCLVLK